jgi:DNA-binding transcriptional regulator PaaX
MVSPAAAAYLNFQNCLSKTIIDSNPLQLQFVPLNATVTFNPSDTLHTLNVTVYGNVSGLATDVTYPAPDDPQWTNPNDTVGKIIDLSKSNNKYTTLFTNLNVLSFTPYQNPSRFCTSVTQGECPLAPVFYANA